ncbi:hypothetical protein [Thermocrinis sp.]
MRLRKRDVSLVLMILSALLIYVLFSKYYKLRDEYYRDYLRHKEIMFLLANYGERKREEPTESLIRELFSSYGVDFRSFRRVETGYEVEGRSLRGERLPALVYALEDRGIRIVKLKTVDNTGEGLFDIYMLLR